MEKLDFLTVQKITLQFKNSEDTGLKLQREMEMEIPFKAEGLDFGAVYWEVLIESKMKMRLKSKIYEMELKSTGIKGIYGTVHYGE